MSCCHGNCGCGSSCKCGKGCGGCKMYGDLNELSSAASTTIVLGAAPKMTYVDEAAVSSGENGCKCGANCNCNSCSCCK